MPPNASLLSVTYTSWKRNEVDLGWQLESKGGSDLTGFLVEHVWLSERPGRRDSGSPLGEARAERIGLPVWYRSTIEDPEARSHTVGGLTPTASYQFRITSVNHRTVGHPSAAKSPGTASRDCGEGAKRADTQVHQRIAEINGASRKLCSQLC